MNDDWKHPRRGPKSDKDSLSPEQINKKTCNRELELVDAWKESGRGELETFPYKERNSYGSLEIKHYTTPVYAYTNEDLMRLSGNKKVVEVIDVELKDLYEKHAKCKVKPCCSAKRDLEELSIIHQLSKEQQEWFNDYMRRRFGEPEPPTIVYKTVELGNCCAELVPLVRTN